MIIINVLLLVLVRRNRLTVLLVVWMISRNRLVKMIIIDILIFVSMRIIWNFFLCVYVRM